MGTRLDVAIVGLGAMGSAAAYHLARRGQRVVGFDRFHPPHAMGSSHGESRIIRRAYWEGDYIPLVQRAYARWEELERESGRRLITRTGAVLALRPDGEILRGCLRNVNVHGIAHEVLSPEALPARFPLLRAPKGHVGFFEPSAGVLAPEACIEAHLDGARAAGAGLRFDEPVAAWSATGAGVRVRTTRGVVDADQLVLSAGPWMPSLAGPPLGLTVERQTMHWFAPPAGRFGPTEFPVFLVEHAPDRVFYGAPDLGSGVKVAIHHDGQTTTADAVDRSVGPDDVERVQRLASAHLPALGANVTRSTVCLYTNTRDEHFIIGRHPAHDNVLIVSPCSGHGFKFASAIGETVADLATTGRARHDVAMFGMGRFGELTDRTPSTGDRSE